VLHAVRAWRGSVGSADEGWWEGTVSEYQARGYGFCRDRTEGSAVDASGCGIVTQQPERSVTRVHCAYSLHDREPPASGKVAYDHVADAESTRVGESHDPVPVGERRAHAVVRDLKAPPSPPRRPHEELDQQPDTGGAP